MFFFGSLIITEIMNCIMVVESILLKALEAHGTVISILLENTTDYKL